MTNCKNGKQNSLAEQYLKEDESKVPYFITWYDYIDDVSHGLQIYLTKEEEKDPGLAATGFLMDYVGQGNYLLENIERVKEGDTHSSF